MNKLKHKTMKKFFTLFLALGISLSAACMTANEMFQPDYPKHIYGGAVLDSIVEISSYGDEYHILFDEKGRMVLHRDYELDPGTSKSVLYALVEFEYKDGGVIYTICNQHVWNSQAQQWADYKVRFDNIVYDASGNLLKLTMLRWNDETNTWDEELYSEYRYDSYGNIVLARDSGLVKAVSVDEHGNMTVSDPKWETHTQVYEYEYDAKGRVIVQIGEGKTGRTEYTYNSLGDILEEKNFYQQKGYYDEQKEEYKEDTTWWVFSSTTQYIYNAFNNVEKKIEYNSENIEQRQITYYYSYQTSTTEVENAEVAATPSENYSVILQWPAVEGADTYTLDIRKNGELVCTLIFNAHGQLTGISFAPDRKGNAHNMPTATQTTKGWKYKIECLEADTKYSYTATAKMNDLILTAQTVFFTTSLQAIEDIHTDYNKPVKVHYNGQILILRGDKTFTLQGQEVK